MDESRWCELMASEDGRLTRAEMVDGWHFCPDFDYLLCRFGDRPVLRSCTCDVWTEAEMTEEA